MKALKRISISILSIMLLISAFSLQIFYAKASEELVNIAEKAVVEGSQVTSPTSAYQVSKINDGMISLNSYWDTGEKRTESPYAIMDLKGEYSIKEIKLYHYWDYIYGTTTSRWYQYEVYASSNKEDWQLIVKKDNENIVTKTGDSYTIGNDVKARYIKVVCTASNINGNITHLVELQVFVPASETLSNVALNKKVTASQGQVSYITNGSKGDMWDGGEGPQSFIIDLVDYYQLDYLHSYPYWDGKRYYHYEVFASDNGFNWTKVAEKNNTSIETSSGTIFDINDEIVARYIKVTMKYNSANTSVHMREFEVYGKKIEQYQPSSPTDPEDANNISFNKPTRANISKHTSQWVVDGSLDTAWSTYTFPSNIDIDLEKSYVLKDMTLYFPVAAQRYYQYSVYTSLDGINFSRLIQKRNHNLVDEDGDIYTFEDVMARYVRVNVEFVSEGSMASLCEIRIHGNESEVSSLDRQELKISSFYDSPYAAEISKSETIEAIYSLVERRLGAQYKDWFVFDLSESINEGEDFYQISNENGKIKIIGNKGVSITTGLNYYLKYICKVSISQQNEQLATMPESIVLVEDTIMKSTPLTVRYAYNYCTLSYTNAFYGQEEWQRELDWLALNGVNVILDTTGQEAVWVDFLQKIGYSSDDAKSWLVGPAYTAWQYMSNMENFGGPIHDQYILDRLELARSNMRKMRVLGISPVLQGYAGMIPSDYENVVDDKETYADIINNMMPQGKWGGQFNRPDMLKTNSEVFQYVADLFYESQTKVLGDISSYYAIDPFHEGGIPPTDMSSSEISETVLAKMMEHDENAVWMIQSWESNPTKTLLDGLGEHREEHAIILDLSATTHPHYNNAQWGEEFYGTSWIYCLLDNFGDRPGVHGELEVIASQVIKARNSSSHMKGIGITPEGTKLNPVNYELFFETAWEDTIDMKQWLKAYVERRYATFSDNAYEAWLKLLDSAYGSEGAHWGGVNSIINYRPGMSIILGNNQSIPYNTKTFDAAIRQLLKDYDVLSSSEAYLYDIAALLQQQLQNVQLSLYRNFEQAYTNGDLEAFNQNAQLFLNSISLMDEVVATQTDGLLGNWIGMAKDRSEIYDDFSQDIFEFNAKSLITTWGGRNSAKTLGDYAYRQYAGLLNDYVKPRWEKYISSKRDALENGSEYHAISYDEYFNDMWDFILSKKEYTRDTTDAKTSLKFLSKEVQTYVNEDVKEVHDDNIAINAYVTSSNGATSDHPHYMIQDNDDTTLWVAKSSEVPSSVTLDLSDSYSVYKIQTVFEKEPAASRNLFIEFYVEVYHNGEWEIVLEDKTSVQQQSFNIKFDDVKEMSKIRVTIKNVDGALYPAIAEVRVFSSKGIMVLDDEKVVREDDYFYLLSEANVADMKKFLSAEVGELKFFRNEVELFEHDVLETADIVKLLVDGVVVDEGKMIITPEKVENVQVIQENYKAVTLTWDKSKGATSYTVYRKGYHETSEFTLVDIVDDATISISGLATGKTYTFYVVANNQFGEAKPSEFVQFATHLNGEVLLSIEKNTNAKFTLNWTAVDGATRYIIYRKSTISGWKKVLTLGKDARTYTTKDMLPDTYSYVVKAARYDSVDRVMTNASNEVSITSTLENDCIKLNISKESDTSVALQWNKLNNMIYYEVYRQKDDGIYRLIKRTKATNTIATSLKTNSTYRFKVRGYNLISEQKVYSPFSAEVIYKVE